MASERVKSVWAGVGLVVLAMVWGTQFLVIKRGQVDLPPLMSAMFRFAVLTIAAQAAVWFTRSQAPPGQRLHRTSFGVTQAITFGLLYWAQSRIPSALAGVLVAAVPFFVAVMARRILPAERLTLARVGALTLGFAGVSMIVFGTQSTGGDAEALAVCAILVGDLAAATNKVLAKQLIGIVPVPLLLRDMGFIVTALTGLASFCLERHQPMQFTPGAMLAFLYLGLVASFAASGLYLALLRRFTVTAMAYLQFATASVAAITGVVLGGERFDVVLAGGVAAVIGGLFVLSKTEANSSICPVTE